jgi:hypothetical protein
MYARKGPATTNLLAEVNRLVKNREKSYAINAAREHLQNHLLRQIEEGLKELRLKHEETIKANHARKDSNAQQEQLGNGYAAGTSTAARRRSSIHPRPHRGSNASMIKRVDSQKGSKWFTGGNSQWDAKECDDEDDSSDNKSASGQSTSQSNSRSHSRKNSRRMTSTMDKLHYAVQSRSMSTVPRRASMDVAKMGEINHSVTQNRTAVISTTNVHIQVADLPLSDEDYTSEDSQSIEVASRRGSLAADHYQSRRSSRRGTLNAMQMEEHLSKSLRRKSFAKHSHESSQTVRRCSINPARLQRQLSNASRYGDYTGHDHHRSRSIHHDAASSALACEKSMTSSRRGSFIEDHEPRHRRGSSVQYHETHTNSLRRGSVAMNHNQAPKSKRRGTIHWDQLNEALAHISRRGSTLEDADSWNESKSNRRGTLTSAEFHESQAKSLRRGSMAVSHRRNSSLHTDHLNARRGSSILESEPLYKPERRGTLTSAQFHETQRRGSIAVSNRSGTLNPDQFKEPLSHFSRRGSFALETEPFSKSARRGSVQPHYQLSRRGSMAKNHARRGSAHPQDHNILNISLVDHLTGK